MQLAESYSSIRGASKGVAKAVGLGEIVQAKRTMGNIETIFDIDALTDWDEEDSVSTEWIKTQTKIGGN